MRLTKYIIILIFFASPTWALNVELVVKETQGIARTNEMVHNGIPIAKSENITATTNLIIEDSFGSQVEASFEILSRWNGGPTDTSNEIQWLLVSFPATVSGNSTATYYLKIGTPISHSTTISVTDGASDITVATGGSTFVISETAATVFDTLKRGVNTIASSNGSTTSTINGQSAASGGAPTVTIERETDHYVCILSEGQYSNTPVGSSISEPIYYKFRYEFYAGDPTAYVSHKFYWPGSTSLDNNNPITLDGVSVILPDMSGYSSTDIRLDSDTYYAGVVTSVAYIEQERRTLYADADNASINHNASSDSQTYATAPMLLNFATNGSVGVSIDQMKNFAPQKISTDSNGKITIHPMSNGQYFAACQGAWSRFAVSVLDNDATYSEFINDVLAPLEHRLFAFPTRTYVSSSGVFLEFPNNNSDTNWENELSGMISTSGTWYTSTQRNQGLMTWGSTIRYDYEIGSNTDWAKWYDGAVVTNYHNVQSNTVFEFIRNGDPDVIYNWAYPYARRMLHTQIIQPNDSISSTYMGWGYSGYQRYRADTNSSHCYFDNLFLYYYLSGDKEVIDILNVGADTRDDWYTRDPGGDLNDQDSDDAAFVDYTGRVASQVASIFNFLGHTYDSKYLDDFKHMYNHATSQSLVLLSNGDGKEYGFIAGDTDVTTGFITTQFWMNANYFMHYLYCLYNEQGNVSLGSSSITVERLFKAIANSYQVYVSDVDGDGTWSGSWLNQGTVSYTGNKIGGTITEIALYPSSDSYLYVSGKTACVTLIARAAKMNDNTVLESFAQGGVTYIEGTAQFSGISNTPIDKVNGLYLTRYLYALGSLYNNSANSTAAIGVGTTTNIGSGTTVNIQ